MVHTPVLKKEVLEYLDPKDNENFIDATVGEAGHTMLILEKNGPNGKVLGIDQDLHQIENAKLEIANYKERVILINDSYSNIGEIVERVNFKPVDGILLDLGYSSWQMKQSKRGFSFMKDEYLDMRYNLNSVVTAEKIINEYTQSDLERILKNYGEERFAKQIAKKIVGERKIKRIKTTFELMDVITRAIPMFAQSKHRGLSNWAKAQIGAKSFQALRIAVNSELDNLTNFLSVALSVLSSGGRLVIISFHSLEDRIVKNFFKEHISSINILTKKPIIAQSDEVLENPRSRSAKLRAITKK
ncbi:MAG: 16S rRNA (cytosine(1402)-N(4))-methyltransferase [Candidatus Staskawiczbacteria bacterium RIFCSPHIGHO2_01_FULL_34_27]|uniref:Ribosomal RNA small subunit methyltransferase H n=1 Tax=Candidatus Staskawiczbacteria bacterium RIFCSPHIGHO2_01_FULL_34_27 TaxID=1802199 RepID=A0A1G2HKC8_9BACT|nr:MAG: 16S rRNA (cytosine(1402)-N(4))-methyltransferase [Candidatus Staskawiczbacteria bacterium RIFCSPHIGHO2_01_FULL_34_27]